MIFLEYYKPKNLWKLINQELNLEFDKNSIIYISAAKDFAELCRSMGCNDYETFEDVYKGISKSALTLYKIYGFNELTTRELILYAITKGAKHIDINTYKEIITNIIKFGDKKIVSAYLGCLLDIAEHLGIERTTSYINFKETEEISLKQTLKQE